MRALFTSRNLIGDALYISCPLRMWITQQMAQSGEPLSLWFQTLNDHVAPLYKGMIRDWMNEQEDETKRQWFSNVSTVFDRPSGSFDFEHTFDVSAAFALSDQKKQHVAESYAELLGVTLPDIGSMKVGPIFIPSLDFKTSEEMIFLSMFSNSCTSRDKNTPGLPPNKMLPLAKWKPMIRLIRHEYPTASIRTLGAPDDKYPVEFEIFLHENYVEPYVIHGTPLDTLAAMMKKAKLVVTIDNGMSHLAASQHTPTFLMYPRCLGPHYILPIGNPNLSWVHMDPVLVNPAQLVYALEQGIKKLKALETNDASFRR